MVNGNDAHRLSHGLAKSKTTVRDTDTVAYPTVEHGLVVALECRVVARGQVVRDDDWPVSAGRTRE